MKPAAQVREPSWRRLAFVALGSNLGESRQNILAAFHRLKALADEPLRESSLWQTTPEDCPPGSPPFVNAIVGLVPRPEETPESLLTKLQAIETEFGRRPRQVLNEPRPLDLDLISFQAEIRATKALTLPHPRAHRRRFVLQPLSELAPDLVLPGQTASVSRLLAALPPDRGMFRIVAPGGRPATGSANSGASQSAGRRLEGTRAPSTRRGSPI